jgi:hypothetical protein
MKAHKRMTRNEKTFVTSELKSLSDNDLSAVVGGKGDVNHAELKIVKLLDVAAAKFYET